MLDKIYARATTGRELLKRFEHVAAERRAALVLIQGGKGGNPFITNALRPRRQLIEQIA